MVKQKYYKKGLSILWYENVWLRKCMSYRDTAYLKRNNKV